MFPKLDDDIKSTVDASGEMQRAYLVVAAHQEAYDAFVAKYQEKYVSAADDLHREAVQFADSVLWVVFGQNRT